MKKAAGTTGGLSAFVDGSLSLLNDWVIRLA